MTVLLALLLNRKENVRIILQSATSIISLAVLIVCLYICHTILSSLQKLINIFKLNAHGTERHCFAFNFHLMSSRTTCFSTKTSTTGFLKFGQYQIFNTTAGCWTSLSEPAVNCQDTRTHCTVQLHNASTKYITSTTPYS